MKTRFHFLAGSFIATTLAVGMIVAHSAPQEKQAPSKAQLVESNAIPQSSFIIPTSSEKGRDPFFPNSHYMSGAQVIKMSTSAPVTLVLNGLSGTQDHRLAIINGRTFAEGEESDVHTTSGRVRVHCIQIKGEMVVVEVAGERRELRLRD